MAAPDEGLGFFLKERLDGRPDVLPKPILDRIVARRTGQWRMRVGVWYLGHGVISLAVPAAGWVGSSHPEIAPPNNFHHFRDMTINSMFEKDGRWQAFTAFLDDGRICLTNNAAERALRGVALGRKSWLFAGSERGGDRATAMHTPIVTAKMNDIDP